MAQTPVSTPAPASAAQHRWAVLVGALVGAALGAWAGHLLWQQAAADPQRGSPLDARQGLRLALIVLKTLRQIAGLNG